MPCLAKRRLERDNNQTTDESGITESHFCLRRMNVNIDKSGIAFEEQGERGVTVARKKIGVSTSHSTDQHLVADRPAVHEQELHHAVGAIVGRQSRVTPKNDALARGLNRNSIVCKLATHDTR